MVDLKKTGKTIIIASHDPLITDNPQIDRIVEVRDGRVDVS
jgi:putative ABC transport system ATP-binding protein